MSQNSSATPPLVVVGAGLAGWTTVRELRKLDPTTPVTLITADSGDFYAKPALSNALAQRKGPAQLVSTPAAQMAQTLGVTLLAHTRVQAIDPAMRTLRTAQDEWPWRQLVLATGAQPLRVPLQGNAADAVHSVNTLSEFAEFHARLTAGARRVLLMGAGLIGCEFANDLAAAGYAVEVVDRSARPLAGLLPEAASAQLQAALTALGVRWHFGQTVQAVDRDGDGLRVTLSDGTALAADLVLSAIGLRADTRLAEAAGLACERGIVVDAQLRTSAEGIYALGDGAQYTAAGGRTLPFVMPILHAAKVLAAVLAGQPATLNFPAMPVAVKTPALPLVVAPPAPGTAGGWRADGGDAWQWLDPHERLRGFTLAGAATPRRAQWAAALAAA